MPCWHDSHGEFSKFKWNSFSLLFTFTLSVTLPVSFNALSTLLWENLWCLVLILASADISGAMQIANPPLFCFTNSIKKAILIESSSSMWQLKPLTNYSDKYIYGNHRNCILCDVWRGVVTQNYLLLCWRTQWRIFSKLKVKRAETLATWEQIPQLLPKLVPLYSNL